MGDSVQTGQHSEGSKVGRFLVFLSSLTIVTLTVIMIRDQPGIIHFKFSYSAITLLIAVLANAALLILVATRHSKINGSFWLSLFIGNLVCWGILSSMQYMSINPTYTVFWSLFASSFGAFVPLLGLMFVLSQTHPRLIERTVFPWVGIFATGFFFVGTNYLTSLFIDHDPNHVVDLPYALETPLGPGLWVWYLWIQTVLILIIGLLVRHYRKQKDETARKQGMFMLIGAAITAIAGSVFDILLPLIGIHEFMPMAMPLSTVQAAAFAYGMLRYNLFVINPATVAPNILSTMAESVLVTDTSYRILFLNAQAQKILGTVQVKDFHKISHINSVFPAEVFKHMHERIKGEVVTLSKVVDFDDVALTGEHMVSVDISVSPIADDENHLSGIVWVLNDVSNLKAANAKLAEEKSHIEQKVVERTHELSLEHARLLASVENLSVGFVMLNQQDEIITFNKMATKLFATPAALEVRRQLYEALDLRESIIRCKKNNHVVNVGERAYGSKFLHVVLSPVTSSHHSVVMGVVILLEDITKEKQFALERNQFVMTSSHEMRTPVAIIEGALSSAINPQLAQLDERGKVLVTKAYQQARHLGELFQDIETVAQIQNGEKYPEAARFDVVDAVLAAGRTSETQAQEKHLTLTVKAPASLSAFADPSHITEALKKLLDNAIAYTHHGEITIQVEQKESEILIHVHDTGIGIAPEDQDKLFKQFSRIQNELTRETSGTGLGLYIAKSLVEMNGGRLSVASKVNDGSTFTIALPQKESSIGHA